MDEADDITKADSMDQRETARTDSCSESLWSEFRLRANGKLVNQELIEAAEYGDHEGVSRALGKGAEITFRDSDGYTSLHLGAENGHDIVVKTLPCSFARSLFWHH